MLDFQDAIQFAKNMDSKTYAYVPICYNDHWSLVIICHPRCPKADDRWQPGLLHLDSVDNPVHVSKEIFPIIEKFMRKTSWKRGGKILKIQKRRVSISKQVNGYDYGVFVLWSMQKIFLKCPQHFTEKMYNEHAKMVSAPNLSNIGMRGRIQKACYFCLDVKGLDFF
jgi:sentrin-specific protease 7